ncbi:MAG: hypothetical protein ACREDR_33115, partial [Blastocatellia bacterium]
LGLVPSSEAAALAYADGLLRYGAQPFSRTDDDFYSYIYTDRGRTYRSHDWDGKVIGVHRDAMQIDGGLGTLLVEQRVGILEDLMIRHLLARGYNAKEKQIERVHKDISSWERNRFAEYCGPDAKHRPDAWKKLYAQHQRHQRRQGESLPSPFITFDVYREGLAEFMVGYNSTPHERLTLGGERIVPLEEFKRLYTVRYEISTKTVALLLIDSRPKDKEERGSVLQERLVLLQRGDGGVQRKKRRN